jgi:uncharacterized MAPEG superfamily protein
VTIIELSTLIVGLSLVAAISAQAIYSDLAFGLRYSASARDEPRDDLLSRRLARVAKNQVEGVAMFAPLAILAGGGSTSGVLGWILLAYAISRTLHGLLQTLGATTIRSAVWLIGFGCLLVAYLQVVISQT